MIRMNDYFDNLAVEISINPFTFQQILIVFPTDGIMKNNISEMAHLEVRVEINFNLQQFEKWFNSIGAAREFKKVFEAAVKADMADIIMQGVFQGLKKNEVNG